MNAHRDNIALYLCLRLNLQAQASYVPFTLNVNIASNPASRKVARCQMNEKLHAAACESTPKPLGRSHRSKGSHVPMSRLACLVCTDGFPSAVDLQGTRLCSLALRSPLRKSEQLLGAAVHRRSSGWSVAMLYRAHRYRSVRQCTTCIRALGVLDVMYTDKHGLKEWPLLVGDITDLSDSDIGNEG